MQVLHAIKLQFKYVFGLRNIMIFSFSFYKKFILKYEVLVHVGLFSKSDLQRFNFHQVREGKAPKYVYPTGERVKGLYIMIWLDLLEVPYENCCVFDKRHISSHIPEYPKRDRYRLLHSSL
ncbi:hypothetical protein VNO77_02617 [Canavalia gladiata]|uniref:Uncharacterized protein n=1 Tax=Canavalia gladiata TaxID=3824 RepID=A0AAN9MT89_CANGL